MWNKCLPLIQIRLFWSFYNILLLIITVSNENIPPLPFFFCRVFSKTTEVGLVILLPMDAEK